MTLPAPGVGLDEKQALNKALLRCGAPIREINTVRRHLSAIKGGRLAAAAHPARVLTWLISDVPGDEASLIASGPTLPDATTPADAWRFSSDTASRYRRACVGIWKAVARRRAPVMMPFHGTKARSWPGPGCPGCRPDSRRG